MDESVGCVSGEKVREVVMGGVLYSLFRVFLCSRGREENLTCGRDWGGQAWSERRGCLVDALGSLF